MRIVVGLDRSESAFAALQYALSEAAAHGVGLTVVTSWEAAYDVPYRDVEAFEALRQELAGEAERVAALLVGEAQNDPSTRAVTVQVRAVEGPPERVLLAAVDPTDVLVVGRHGGGAVRRLVLGSVSAALAREAPCPVTVVPSRHGGREHHLVSSSEARLARELAEAGDP